MGQYFWSIHSDRNTGEVLPDPSEESVEAQSHFEGGLWLGGGCPNEVRVWVNVGVGIACGTVLLILLSSKSF